MSTISEQRSTTSETCPQWCVEHIDDPDVGSAVERMHRSATYDIEIPSVPGERNLIGRTAADQPLTAHLLRAEADGVTLVELTLSGGSNLTDIEQLLPAEARELAKALTELADRADGVA